MLFFVAWFPVIAMAAIQTKTVLYRDGDTVLEGFVAYDDAKTAAPGVMIVHQWKGIGEYEKGRARMLAEMGYVGFCADIYGQGIRPTNAQESGQQASKYRGDLELFRKRLNLGLEELKKQPGVDASKLAAIGYCFGGTGALELARSGAEVKAVVSFHGGLGTTRPEDAKRIKAKVLVAHGAVDPLVPPAQVSAFQKEMEDAKVDYVFVAYAGAVHSFTEVGAGNNPDSPARYDEKADRRSWQHMKEFLAEAFGR
jgi:dienelactone hydrolase